MVRILVLGCGKSGDTEASPLSGWQMSVDVAVGLVGQRLGIDGDRSADGEPGSRRARTGDDR